MAESYRRFHGPEHGQQENLPQHQPHYVLIPDKSNYYEKCMVSTMVLTLFLILLFTISKIIPDLLYWLNIVRIYGQASPATLSEYVWCFNLVLIPLAFNSLFFKDCRSMYLYIISSVVVGTLPLLHIILYYSRDVWYFINGTVFTNRSMVVWWDEYPYGMYLYYFVIPAIILQSLAQKYGWELIKCWKLIHMIEEININNNNRRGPRRERELVLPEINPIYPAVEEIRMYEERRRGAVFRGRGRRGYLMFRGRGRGRYPNPMLPPMERYSDMFFLRGRANM